jgi:glycosyltransferase involved in cell wall biosynthesis
MNMLVINWQDINNPLAGGAEIYLFEIFSRLARSGHEVTLLCSGFRGARRSEIIKGIKVVRLGSRNNFNFVVPAALRALLRHNDFQLIIDDLNKIPFYTPRLVKLPVLALLMHLFRKGIFHEVSLPSAGYVYLMESLIPFAYNNTNFAVLSPSSKQDLLDLGLDGSRIEVIPPGIDLDRFRPDGSKKGQNLILHTGRIKRYKCIDQLLSAAAVLKRRRSDFRVVIVGEGDDRGRLENLTRELKIGDCVRFLGYVPEAGKVILYQQAAVLVETSIKEGWGMIVIEANGCGTPVIAANSPGLRDSVVDGKTGLLYRFGDSDDLVRKIELVLDDRAERERMGTAGREWARRFSWDGAAGQMLKLIQRSIDE